MTTSASPSHHSPTYETDGKESIEHQLEIHIIDLQETNTTLLSTSAPSQSSSTYSSLQQTLIEILAGIRYVMEYRIRGSRMSHMDRSLCQRLADSLLHCIRGSSRSSIYISTVQECAMVLFGEFVEEVDDFADAVRNYNASDLEVALSLHRWICSSSAAQRHYAIEVLARLCVHVLVGSDSAGLVKDGWHEFILDRYQEQVKEILKKEGFFQANYLHPKATPPASRLFPPQTLSFDRGLERVLDMYSVKENEGLSTEAVQRNSEWYGKNELPKAKSTSLWLLLWRQLSDFMIITMIVSVVLLSFLDGTPFTASVILLMIVVVFNVAVGFWQEWTGSKTLNALSQLSVPTAIVLRNGCIEEVAASELVPGDIVQLEEGAKVPADLRLIAVWQLEVIESVLTGESTAVRKSTGKIRVMSRRLPVADCTGNAFMGTTVSKGRALGVVVRIGKRTEIGKISSSLINDSSLGTNSSPLNAKSTTLLQRRLDRLGKNLVIIAVILCLVIGIALFLRTGIAHWKETLKSVIDLAVSVIPEGLVAVVSFTMQLAIRRLSQRSVLVARLAGAETLGSVTVICTDKTGTLTEGKMVAKNIYTSDGRRFDITGKKINEDRNGNANEILRKCSITENDKKIDSLIYAVMFLCNNSSLYCEEQSTVIKGRGDSTEIALKLGCLNAGFSMDGKEWNFCYKINEFAFDSDRKMMSVAFKCKPTEDCSDKKLPFGFLLVKGAPENILERSLWYCTSNTDYNNSIDTEGANSNEEPHSFISIDGSFLSCSPINTAFTEHILNQNNQMASEGLRVLALAYRPFPQDSRQFSLLNTSPDADLAESKLIFLGLVGIVDSPRPNVHESILQCQQAGIRVCMITGDQMKTAIAVAQSIGIYNSLDESRSRAINGEQLDSLSINNIASLHPFPCVFARVSPENKLSIVQALQHLNHFVAMTGDGVNDAPAIKRADVGVAMGISGAEITKQAADIVLLDDNFASIVTAVREGRRIYDNISKFLLYLLSCNSAEVLVGISCIYFKRLPVSDTGILLANIFADIPPSLSLGFEPPEPDVMHRPPHDPSASSIFTPDMILVMCIESTLIASFTIANYAISLQRFPASSNPDYYEHASSFAYVTISLLQIVLALLSKSIYLSIFQVKMFDNWKLIVSVFVSAACIIASLYLGKLFSSATYQLVPLRGEWMFWLLIGVECIVMVVAVEVMKYVLRLKRMRKAGRDL